MRLATAACVLMTLTGGAFAADYPVAQAFGDGEPPPAATFSWDGLYGGIHVAYTRANFHAAPYEAGYETLFAKEAGTALSGAPHGATLLEPARRVDNKAGFGGFVGYNAQYEMIVFGVEVEATHVGMHGTTWGGPRTFNDGWTGLGKATVGFENFAVLKARLGYAFDRFLPFVTVGAALSQARVEVNATDILPGVILPTVVNTASYRKSGTLSGVAYGIGFDYALLDNVILRAEYQHVDFERFRGLVAPRVDTARVGLGVKY